LFASLVGGHIAIGGFHIQGHDMWASEFLYELTDSAPTDGSVEAFVDRLAYREREQLQICDRQRRASMHGSPGIPIRASSAPKTADYGAGLGLGGGRLAGEIAEIEEQQDQHDHEHGGLNEIAAEALRHVAGFCGDSRLR
jgi:hypothetical protein